MIYYLPFAQLSLSCIYMHLLFECQMLSFLDNIYFLSTYSKIHKCFFVSIFFVLKRINHVLLVFNEIFFALSQYEQCF